MKRIILAGALLGATVTCTRETVAVPPEPNPPAKGAPMTARERVQRAYPGKTLQGPAGLAKGVDLFTVVQQPGPPRDVLLGVVVLGEAVLPGADGLVAVAKALPGDAPRLARAAAHLIPGVGVVLDDVAPTLDGARLRFKAGHGAPMRNDRLVEVDLGTGAFTEVEPAGTDPLAALLAAINGDNVSNRDEALRQLGTCAAPGAAAALATLAQTHAVTEIRAEATRLMATCHDANTVAVLMKLLKGPADGQVRMHAGKGLGVLGATEAKPLLEKVFAEDPDPAARAGARRGLRKLR